MMMESSSAPRTGSPWRGAVRAVMASHDSPGEVGARGKTMRGRSAGVPASTSAMLSSLPMKMSFASLCARMNLMFSALKVGKSATEV